MSENSEIKKIDESTKDISDLKDEIKLNESIPEKEIDKNQSNKQSLKLYKNDINIKRPKYYGRTKTLFYIGDTPIFILCESSNKLL